MIILKILLGLILALLLISFVLPGSAHVERATVIPAPACTIHAQIDNFQRFNEWSPWAEIDPNASYTFGGPARGVGSKMSWASDDKNVGSGSQEIVTSEPYSLVESKLDFGSQGTADAFFRLNEVDSGTEVVWGFDTELGMNPIGRYMGLFFDGMIGPDYEKGLANLKELVTSLPADDWCDLEAEIVDTEAMTIAYAEGSSSQDAEAIGAALGEAYGQVMGFLAKQGVAPAGAPIAVSNYWDERGYGFDAGLPLAPGTEVRVPEGSAVQIGQTYAGRAIRVVHRGPYEGLEATYKKLVAYATVNGLEAAERPWDVFVSDPGNTAPEDLETHLYYPIG